MGKPAARIGDMHVCPMVDGLKPHVGGPVMGPGVPTVLIGGMPAAVMGDMCTCVGPPDTIVLGSTGVLIGGKPAARMGDQCAHGGAITLGCPTVLIGETMAGGGGGSFGAASATARLQSKAAMPASLQAPVVQVVAMMLAAVNGKPFVHKSEDCTDCTTENKPATKQLSVGVITKKATVNISPKTTIAQNAEEIAKERKKLAIQFYKDNNPNMSDEDVASHVNGIDLFQPVEIISIPPNGDGANGDTVYQFQKLNAQGDIVLGSYYAADENSKPTELGISDKYNVTDKINSKVVKTDEIKEVKQAIIKINKPIRCLKSTAKKIDDTWSLKNVAVPAVGGAKQIYIPKK